MSVNEESVFAEAMDKQAPHDRAAFLDYACAGNPGLRQSVESLLSAYDAGQFLEAPAPGLNATMGPTSTAESPGAEIGPYKLLEQVGEGGMGLVFMADQLRPVRRRVALKIIKPGMDSRQVIARFEAERQALALMDHTNIARVFDAGTTASGRPYFAMELVRGIPITDYCDEHKLAIRQRLELFVQVCQAVQHAHQKGVIHRDLKPSNVLVAHDDTVPLPKIIDFGIAKATSQPLTERTLFTALAQVVGTPLYMSPEQAALNHLDVDTRSDVYSLGVLLYELLTGTTPFEQERLRQAGLDEVRRIIREEEPPRPSTRVSTLGAVLTTVSQRRSVDPRRISVALSGDLDWIVMKSLEKDRQRRYESASALAADLGRYLRNEAVEACPPSAAYRLRKFARRNRRVLVSAGVVALALVAATVVSTWQALRARNAQHQAEADRERAKVAESQAATEAAVARAVNDFLQGDLLGQAASAPQLGQEFGGDPSLTVREALDRAAARIGQRFEGQPLVEAAIQLAIGDAYNSLHEHQPAMSHLERAFALRKAGLGPEHPDTLVSMNSLATACMWVGRLRDAIALYQQILENRKALLGPDHPDTLACVGSLAVAYAMAGQWDTSELLLQQLLEKQGTILGPTHPATLGTMHQLAITHVNSGRLTEAIALYEKVLEVLKSTTGPENQIYCMLSFAVACQHAGKLDQAERLLREALEYSRKRRDSLGRISTANTLGWLGRTLLLQERYAEAESLLREAESILDKEQPDGFRRFYWASLLGTVLLGQQRNAEAEALLLQGYEGMKQREAVLPANERRRLAETGERIVRFYETTNQPEKAHTWREKLASGNRPGT